MSKIRDLTKKLLPYIIVNLAGEVISVLGCFFDRIAIVGLFGVFLFWRIPLPVTVLMFIIINIAACIAVIANKNIAGLILAIPYGSLGALIGTLFNRAYKFKKAVRIIFNVHIWLCVWGVAGVFYIGSHF